MPCIIPAPPRAVNRKSAAAGRIAPGVSYSKIYCRGRALSRPRLPEAGHSRRTEGDRAPSLQGVLSIDHPVGVAPLGRPLPPKPRQFQRIGPPSTRKGVRRIRKAARPPTAAQGGGPYRAYPDYKMRKRPLPTAPPPLTVPAKHAIPELSKRGTARPPYIGGDELTVLETLALLNLIAVVIFGVVNVTKK